MMRALVEPATFLAVVAIIGFGCFWIAPARHTQPVAEVAGQ